MSRDGVPRWTASVTAVEKRAAAWHRDHADPGRRYGEPPCWSVCDHCRAVGPWYRLAWRAKSADIAARLALLYVEQVREPLSRKRGVYHGDDGNAHGQ